jgi:pimeloyl-ACP methyl ester carboxylesterase
LLAQWAAGLAADGVAVLRFDFRGSGESSGAWTDTTFGTMLSDQVAVGTWARESLGALPLVTAGISIGGVPAALAAPRLGAVGTMLLSSDLIEGVRFGVNGSTPIRGGEFHLPHRFFRERELLRPRTELHRWGRPWALIHGARDAKVRAAAAELAQLGCRLREIDDADHLFESAAARTALLGHSKALIDEILDVDQQPVTPATGSMGQRP